MAVGDAALRRGSIDERDLTAAVRHLLHDDVRYRMVTAVDSKADSILESIVRVELMLRGFAVRVQVAHAHVGHVDLVVQGWLVVELDGFAHHGDRASFRNDRRRDVELARQGRTVLRFTYEDVVQRRQWLIDAIVDVLTWRDGQPAR